MTILSSFAASLSPVENKSTLPELATVLESRGCCAETLAWILGIHHRQLFYILHNELPEVSAIIKAAQKEKTA